MQKLMSAEPPAAHESSPAGSLHVPVAMMAALDGSAALLAP